MASRIHQEDYENGNSSSTSNFFERLRRRISSFFSWLHKFLKRLFQSKNTQTEPVLPIIKPKQYTRLINPSPSLVQPLLVHSVNSNSLVKSNPLFHEIVQKNLPRSNQSVPELNESCGIASSARLKGIGGKKVSCLPQGIKLNLSSSKNGEQEEKNKKVISKTIVSVDERILWVNYYSNKQRILIVGDGDFSFSAALAVGFHRASNMIATSLNSEEFLKKNYCMAPSNIEKLRSRGCIVMHGIDATTLAIHQLLGSMRFDRIIFNFPFAGFFKESSRQDQIKTHTDLVSSFMMNARKMINEDGEIHISHKTNGFHREWKLETIGSSQGLKLREAVEFDISDYPGYNTKYGFGGDNNFNWTPSKTYKFRLNLKGCLDARRVAEPIILEKWVKHYCNNHKILLIGEGDFSFAACLATAFGRGSNIVATCLDSKEDVVRKHETAVANLRTLKKKGSTIIHGVHSRTLYDHPLLTNMKFDRIVFNFPHARFELMETDAHQIRFHQRLVQRFLSIAKDILHQNGEVHVTQKTSHPFSMWKIEELGEEVGLQFIGKVPFYQSEYPGYLNRRAGAYTSSSSTETFLVGPCSTFKFVKSCSTFPICNIFLLSSDRCTI